MANRRQFIQTAAMAGLGVSLSNRVTGMHWPSSSGKRIGIIGLDTSHSVAFTKEFNNPEAGPELRGYKVVAAYPHGSRDIESSVSRIPGYTA